MLTLKVITTDQEGQHETHLFYGERIQHKEVESNDYSMGRFEPSNRSITINSFTEKGTSEQKFTYSSVFIYGEGETPKQLLWILPCADCYIMHEGKTIDTFSARFK